MGRSDLVNLFLHVTAFNRSDYSIDHSNCRTAARGQNKFTTPSACPPVWTSIDRHKTVFIWHSQFPNPPTTQFNRLSEKIVTLLVYLFWFFGLRYEMLIMAIGTSSYRQITYLLSKRSMPSILKVEQFKTAT